MTFGLARKELRDLRPFLWLAVVCIVVDLVDVMLEQTDQNGLSTDNGMMKGSWLTLQLLLAFAIGTGLLVREQDNGTLSFLDGLPITRTQMFVTKVWTAVTVLMLYPTVAAILTVLFHVLSRNSLTHAIHPHLLLASWSLNALAALFGLSLGMVLGYFRNLAWALGATLATAVALVGRWVPRVLLIDPTELLNTPFIGYRWPLSLEAIGAQLGLSAIFLLIGWRLFAGGSSWLARLAEAMKRPVLSALAGIVTVAAVFAVIWAFNEKPSDDGGSGTKTKDAEIVGVDFGGKPMSHLATKHYTFAYEGDSTKVLAASKHVDAIYEEISKDLPTTQTEPIDVDLSGTMANTGGTAYWNRIRMPLSARDMVGTLAHETVHVLADRMLKENGRDELDQMSMFNEGLAEWVAYRYGEGEDGRASDQLLAAVVFARREIALEELFEFGRFTQKHDRSLVYPLGSAFISALTTRYGVDAPAKILGGMGKKDFPAGLAGYALYQAAFQLAGFDLSLVVDDFWKLLAGWAKERKDEVAAFPRLRGSVEAGATALDVRVAGDKPLPEGWSLLVRFRPTSTSELRDFYPMFTRNDRARRSRRDIVHDTLCFQPGLEGHDRTIYEPWQCVKVEWADDDASLPKTSDP